MTTSNHSLISECRQTLSSTPLVAPFQQIANFLHRVIGVNVCYAFGTEAFLSVHVVDESFKILFKVFSVVLQTGG